MKPHIHRIEVKAMVLGVEMIKSLTGLWAEFVHQPHGCVRVLDDSKPLLRGLISGSSSRLGFPPKPPGTFGMLREFP